MNYQIQPGDTLSSIAARNGTTVAALLAANPSITNQNQIRAGSALTIPLTGQSIPAPNATSTSTRQPFFAPAPFIPPTSTAPPVAPTAAASVGSTTSRTPVTLGNGTTVYVDQNGKFYDSAGNSVSNAAVEASTPQSATTGSPGGTTGGTGGNAGGAGGGASDPVAASGGFAGLANQLLRQGNGIPKDLQITPALIKAFTDFAHQNADPFTKQLLDARIADVNANLSNLAVQYGNDLGRVLQNFGTSLATEQNTAAGSGTAFSGQRGLAENNLVAGTNRDISTLASTAANQVGSAARAAAADVGSANAGQIVLPTLAGGRVSTSGTGGPNLGSNVGGFASGPTLDYNFNPSIYTVGNIPDQGIANVNKQTQNFISQFGNLAAANTNSGRSVSDLIGSLSGLPTNYTVPNNLT